jgi:hypothetical protein
MQSMPRRGRNRLAQALPRAGMFRPLWGKESVLRRLSHRDYCSPTVSCLSQSAMIIQTKPVNTPPPQRFGLPNFSM